MEVSQFSSPQNYPKSQEKSCHEYINGEHRKIIDAQQNNIEQVEEDEEGNEERVSEN